MRRKRIKGLKCNLFGHNGKSKLCSMNLLKREKNIYLLHQMYIEVTNGVRSNSTQSNCSCFQMTKPRISCCENLCSRLWFLWRVSQSIVAARNSTQSVADRQTSHTVFLRKMESRPLRMAETPDWRQITKPLHIVDHAIVLCMRFLRISNN